MKRPLGYMCLALLSCQPGVALATDLDLSSSSAIYQTSDVPGANGASIIQDGQSTPLGSSLTAAQYVAFMQSTAPGGQQLVVNSQGIATGGALRLDTLGTTASSIAIPQGVTALHDFSTAALNLTGNFVNSGNFYAASSLPSTSMAAISALNIVNGPGALLSTFAPQNLLAGFNLSSSGAPLALSLTAAGNIVNSGTITASALNMTAGGSIINNAGAVMQSINTASLLANAVSNAGLIASVAGNINMNTVVPRDIVVNNVAGILSAAGSINIRDSFATEKLNTTLWGGVLNAAELNIFSGDGAAVAVMDALNSTVNINSGTAVVQASSGNLTLGNIVTSGDPLFYNTNGNVVIRQSITSNSPSPVYIVASGDIVTSPDNGPISINTSGGELFMLAGANVTSNLAPQDQPPPVGTGTLNVTLTINGASQTGGSIDLQTTAPIATISTRGSGAGGEVRLLAMGGNCPTCGIIRLPGSGSITTGGNGAGFDSGNVTIIGSSRTPQETAIVMGSVDTTGGKAGTGSVKIFSQALDDVPFLVPQGFGGGEGGGGCCGMGGDPFIPPPPPTVSITVTQSGVTGSLAEGAIRANNVYTGAVTTNGAAVDIRSGGQLQINGPITTSNLSGPAGAVNLRMGFETGPGYDLEIGTPSGFGSAFINGGIIADGQSPGSITINNINGGMTINGTFSHSNPQGGGTITLSGGSSTIAFDVLDVSSSTGAGGTITISAGSIQSVNNTSPAQILASGATKGGTVTLNNVSYVGLGNNFYDMQIDISGTGNNADAGKLSISNYSQLQIDTSALKMSPGNNGKGADLSFTGTFGFFVSIEGDLDVSGRGVGNGGSVNLSMWDFGSPFVIDPNAAAPLTPGIRGSIIARGGDISGDGGSFTFKGAGIIVPAEGLDVSPTEGAGGTISLIGANLVDLSAVEILNVGAAGTGDHNGGTAIFKSNNVVTVASVPFLINANSTGNANGGSVTINSTITDLILGTQPGQITIQASGGGTSGNQGSVSLFSTNGKVVVNPLGLIMFQGTTNGGGGSVSLNGFKQVAWLGGGVYLGGVGTGKGGSFKIENRGLNFYVGKSLLPAESGVEGDINVSGSTGGTIELNTQGQLAFQSLSSGDLLDAHGTMGDGGKITVFGKVECCAFVYRGALFSDQAPAPPDFFPANPVSFNASGATNGGSITLELLGGGTDLTSGNGVGALAVLNASGANGNGGKVSARHYTNASTGSGEIHVGTTAGADDTLTYNINVSGGGAKGDGGQVTLLSVTHFDVNTSGISAAPGASGNGAKFDFQANSAFHTVQVVGDLNASGTGNGSGGLISLKNFGGNFNAGNLIANGSGAGGGGSILVNTNFGSNALNAGVVSANGGITGTGGQLDISSKMNVTSLSANGGTTSGDAGTATFKSNNSLVFDPASVTLASTSGKGGSLILSGADVFVTGDVDLDGTGGSGGGSLTINVTQAGTPFVIGGPGNGTNGINGAISLNGGSGGSLNLTVQRNEVQLTGGQSISASGTGAGQANGGTISVAANSFSVSGTGAFSFESDGSGTGNGGKITLTNAISTFEFDVPAPTLYVGSGDGQISLSAMSGTGGGNGGTVVVSGGNSSVVIDTSGLNAGPRGATGNGATYQLSAGNPTNFVTADYLLQINGSLSADAAAGGGKGGTIALAYNARNNPNFTIGNSSAESYFNGTLSARGATNGAGDGGVISFRNQFGPTPNSKQTDGVAVSFFVSTSLDASATNGKQGIVDFNNYEVLDIDPITGRATVRQGQLNISFFDGTAIGGKVSIQGAGVNVDSAINGFTLNLARLEALASSANITLTGSGSTIVLEKGNTLIDYDNIGSLSGSYYPNPDPLPVGVIASADQLYLGVANLINNGEIIAGSGFPLQSDLHNLNTITIINVTNSGDLTVSGKGNLFANEINITNTTGNVTANQGAVVGVVTGFASGTFTLNSNIYGLTIATVTADQRADINANGGILTIQSGVTSQNSSVNMTAFGGVNLFSGANIYAGGGTGLNIVSTRGTDQPYFSQPLGILIGGSSTLRAVTGDLTLTSQRFGGIDIGPSVNITAEGGAIAITNTGLNPTNIGSDNFITANGGNLDVSASNSSIFLDFNSSLSSNRSISITATNSTVSTGDNPVITAGDNISFYGGTGLSIAQGNQIGGLIIAGQDISLTSQGNIDIGSKIIATAGSLSTDPSQAVLQPGAINRPGNVTINANLGQGGNVTVGCCTSFTANGGNIIVTAKESINGQGSIWRSYGGIVGFSAGFDIDLTNGTVQSIARLTGGPVDVFSSGDSSAGYVGGATIFQVGLLNIPVTTTYATEKSLRQFANTLHYQLGANTTDNTSADPIVGYQPAAFYPAGSISDSGRIWLTDPTLKGLSITTLQSDFTGTTLEGRGGTVYIDPPPNIGVLLFAGANILAVAPPAVAGPGGPVVPPVIPPGFPGPPGAVPPIAGPVPIDAPEPVPVVANNTQIRSTIILQTDTITEQATVRRDEPQQCQAPVQIGKAGEPDKNPAGTWAVAAATCQIFAIKEEDADVLAAGGTTVASAKGGMAMKEGKMLVMTGQKTMSVYTPVGAVALPAQSAAIIEGKASGVVRVTPLAGGDATLTVGSGDKVEKITTAGGREIIIASNDVDDEELIPTDGVDRITVSARVALADVEENKSARVKVRINKFNKQQLIAKDPLLNCRECLGQMKKRVAEMAKGPDVIEKPKAHLPAGSFSAIRLGAGAINEPGKTDGTGNDAPNNTEREVEQKSNDTAYAGNGHLIPVAAFRSAPARAARQSGLRTMNFDGISVHSHSAAVSYDSQLLNLAEGEAMIVADKPAVVRLTNGAVAQLASGTIAMVNQEGERAFIQVLHDSRSGSVVVRVAGKVVKLSCGQELVVTKEKPAVVMKSSPIGRRRVQSMPASKTHHMMVSEISLPSLLMHSRVFNGLSASAGSHDKHTTRRILKTAAALGVASGSHGQYARY